MDAAAPKRSPEAERFDPPTEKRSWKVAHTRSWDAFLADARARFGDDGALERTLWHGGLQLNGRPLDVDAPPAQVEAGSWVASWSFLREPAVVDVGPDQVLHDAGGLVAVDKPAWLPTQGTRASQRLSLEARLRVLLGAPGLAAVHRLDRQTSGVALFARCAAVAREVGDALAGGHVEKRYLAWVAPPPAREAFTVAGAIGRVPHPARIRFGITAGGKPSTTHFRVCLEREGRSLLEATPRTGRSHQIRVHVASAGSPIAGDDLYGPGFTPGAPSSAPRVLLHAEALRILRGGTRLELRATPPSDMSPA